jgi:hypothetical protein
MTTPISDPKIVAKWMLAAVQRDGLVHQETIVYEISDTFGEEYTYLNENGNLAIRKDVLVAFRKLSEDTIVWDRSDRAWRMREPGDSPGRQQT